MKLHDVAEYRRGSDEGGHVLTTVGRIIYNDRIERALVEALAGEFDPTTYEFINQPMRKRDTVKVIDALVQLHGASVIALVLDAFKDLGFKYATQAGITISKNDVIIPPEKGAILAKVRGRGRRDPGPVRHGPDHPGGAPRGGRRQVDGGHRGGG